MDQENQNYNQPQANLSGNTPVESEQAAPLCPAMSAVVSEAEIASPEAQPMETSAEAVSSVPPVPPASSVPPVPPVPPVSPAAKPVSYDPTTGAPIYDSQPAGVAEPAAQPVSYDPTTGAPLYASQSAVVADRVAPPISYQSVAGAPVAGGQPIQQPASANNQPEMKITYTAVEPGKAEPLPQGGPKLFFRILAIVLALCMVAAVSYVCGRNSQKSNIDSSFSSAGLAPLPEDMDASSPNEVYNAVVQSVVLIQVYSMDDPTASTSASGVIYSQDGYIVTNDHIYANVPNPQFIVTLSNGTEYDATFVAGDSRTDLAVLKVDVSGLPVATFGDSSQAQVGENIITIGNPAGTAGAFTMTKGTISAVDRWATNSSNYSMRFLQIDAAINPGSSGGALVNLYGQVIGITAWKYVGEYYENMGFAIPTTTVKRVADSLIQSGYVTNRAKLGISYTMVNSVTARLNGYDSTGLLVASITSDSPIASSGIAEGDLIIAVDDLAITDSSVILAKIEDSAPGDTLTLTVLRPSSGSSFVVSVALMEDTGSSSYTTEVTSDASSGGNGSFIFGDDSSGSSSPSGTFDFPAGE